MAVKIGTEFLVNNVNQFGEQGHADVAGTSDGNFVVAWESEKRTNDPDYLNFDIQGRMFGSSLPIEDEFQINIITVDRQFRPTITALAEDGFAVSYSSGEDNMLPGTTVTTRLLVASGVPVGDEYSPVYSYYHSNPQSAAFSDGSYCRVERRI